MRQMPHWATEISTAKQGIPELSAIQYYSVNAGELARLISCISICSLVSGWQGCELDKSSMQLGKNDKVEFFLDFRGTPCNIADIYTSLSSTQDPYLAQKIRCV